MTTQDFLEASPYKPPFIGGAIVKGVPVTISPIILPANPRPHEDARVELAGQAVSNYFTDFYQDRPMYPDNTDYGIAKEVIAALEMAGWLIQTPPPVAALSAVA